jgi:hypothetical protein
LFLVFRTATGEERRMEIIWGNKLKSGHYKYIDRFLHYVADGGNDNIRQWRREEVNLQEIYRHIWRDGASLSRRETRHSLGAGVLKSRARPAASRPRSL